MSAVNHIVAKSISDSGFGEAALKAQQRAGLSQPIMNRNIPAFSRPLDYERLNTPTYGGVEVKRMKELGLSQPVMQDGNAHKTKVITALEIGAGALPLVGPVSRTGVAAVNAMRGANTGRAALASTNAATPAAFKSVAVSSAQSGHISMELLGATSSSGAAALYGAVTHLVTDSLVASIATGTSVGLGVHLTGSAMHGLEHTPTQEYVRAAKPRVLSGAALLIGSLGYVGYQLDHF